MVVGYVLIGALAGLIAFVVALLLGASFWLAFGLYALVGSATLVLLAGVRLLADNFADRGKAPSSTVRDNPQDNVAVGEPSIGQAAVAAGDLMRILAVDDDPFILELLPMVSANAGFSEVTPAASGEEALKLLTSSDTPFDCLLLDISMPGMDGIELCRRIRRIPEYKKTPIIMLTAMRDMQNMGDAYRAGATDYATKPFEIENLGQRLQLAQGMINSKRETGSDDRKRLGHHPRPVRTHSFGVPKTLTHEGTVTLIESMAFMSFLSGFSRATDVQFLAIGIDNIDTIHARHSAEQFTVLLKDLAVAAVEYFAADRTLMTYTDDATLLIVTNCEVSVTSPHLEIEFENRLNRKLTEDSSGGGEVIGVSIGGPIQMQDKREERAEVIANRAIALLENRMLDKFGMQIAGQKNS